MNNTIQTSSVKKAFSDLINAWFDYKKVKECEITKREYIKAQRDISIAKIKAQKDIVEKYLELTFQERREVISSMFLLVNKGIEMNNDTLIEQAMYSIVETVKTSPLRDLHNTLSQMNDPDVKAIDI